MPRWPVTEQGGPEVNIPELVAEVAAAFARYEAALVGNDVDTLNELFWNTPHTVRYGVTENLYGYVAIKAFRGARVPPGIRSLDNTAITTFGHDFATASTEFRRAGNPRIGRQTQSWVRFAEGWRVVAAHVSLLA